MATTNFPDGVTNAALNSATTGQIAEDPTLLHSYFDDFNNYTAANWVVTVIGTTPTAALTAGDGGLLLLTDSAGATDGISLQKTPAAFAFNAAKKAWFNCRFKCSDATLSNLQFGLVIVDTTPLDATDGIYFIKNTAAATIDLIVRKNATTGSNIKSAIATLVNDTYITLQWYYDGNGRVFYGVNGTLVGSMDASSTYLPDATNLTVSMTLQNGEAVAKTATIDYIYAAFER
jgi:hypothetical protein